MRTESTSSDRHLILVITVFSLIASACSQNQESSLPIDSVTTITHEYPSQPDRFRVEEVFRYGEIYGSDENMLFGPRDAALGPDGSIYICDSRNYRVLKIDSNGEHQNTFGGAGGGPGEFQLPNRIKIFQNRIYVVERALKRLTLFHADGGLINTYSHPFDLGFRSLVQPINTDTLVALDSVDIREGSTTYTHVTIWLWELGSEEKVPLVEYRFPSLDWYTVNGESIRIRYAYPSWPTWDYQPSVNRLIEGFPLTDFTFRIRDLPSGQLVQTLVIEKPPAVIKERDRERWRDAYRKAYQDDPDREQLARYLPFPEVEPFYYTLQVDPETDLIWIDTYSMDPGAEPPVSFTYTIVSIEHGIVAVGEVPFPIKDVRDNHLVGILPDEDGFEQVVVLAVSW